MAALAAIPGIISGAEAIAPIIGEGVLGAYEAFRAGSFGLSAAEYATVRSGIASGIARSRRVIPRVPGWLESGTVANTATGFAASSVAGLGIAQELHKRLNPFSDSNRPNKRFMDSASRRDFRTMDTNMAQAATGSAKSIPFGYLKTRGSFSVCHLI